LSAQPQKPRRTLPCVVSRGRGAGACRTSVPTRPHFMSLGLCVTLSDRLAELTKATVIGITLAFSPKTDGKHMVPIAHKPVRGMAVLTPYPVSCCRWTIRSFVSSTSKRRTLPCAVSRGRGAGACRTSVPTRPHFMSLGLCVTLSDRLAEPTKATVMGITLAFRPRRMVSNMCTGALCLVWSS